MLKRNSKASFVSKINLKNYEKKFTRLMMGFGIVGSAMAQTSITVPSSSQSPYFNPTAAGHTVTSVFTTTDVVGGYTMRGIPDGMGAFDNGNGTFSLFMNHEIPYPSANTGMVKAHGAIGALQEPVHRCFLLLATATFPMNLAGGATQQFTVQYLSTTVGTHTASIIVNSSDADESVYNYMIEGKSLQDVGIKSLSKSETFVSLYPNPAKDEATLKLNLEDNAHVSATVFDVQGKIVMSTLEKELEKGEREITLNTSSLKNGEYFVQLNNGNKSAKIKLVVIH